MRMLRYLGLLGSFIFFASNELWAQEDVVQKAPPALTVSTLSPRYEKVPETVVGHGYLEPRKEALVNARLNGVTIDAVMVDLGDWVKKGQLLARFDDALIQSDIAQAEAQLAQAEVALRQARNNAKRAQRLLKADAMSRVEGERYLDSEQDAKAKLSAARAQLRARRIQLDYTQVRSPVSGIVSEKSAVLGATVSVGSPLFRIIQDGALAWRAQVPLSALDRLHVGSAATVILDNGSTVSGSVYNIAPTVDQKSREATVFVRLAYNEALHAGMLLSGEFNVGEQRVMLIPADTIQPDDGYNYVWTVDKNNRVHRQRVKLGRQIGDKVEVLEGISPHSIVVARGGGFLAEGNNVRVVSQPKAML